MKVEEKDLNVSENFTKISQHLNEIKLKKEETLKTSLSDTQEVNLLLDKYSEELKIKFKYNKSLCNPDDIKKFLLDSFPNAKISFFKLLKLGFVPFSFLLIIHTILFNILLLKLVQLDLHFSIIIIISFVSSIIVTISLFPSDIKSTKGRFKIE